MNRRADDEAEVLIYEEIGACGVTAKQFVEDLEEITAKTINVRLNTPGGEVYDGTAIHNALRSHPARIVVDVDGVAASAGSFIAMSGDEIRMADNAYLMIHNSHGGVMGSAEEMRAYADSLEKINLNIAKMYAKKSGKDHEHYLALMAAETWFTAEEALAEGLIDRITAGDEDSAAAAKSSRFDFAIYNKVPPDVMKRFGTKEERGHSHKEIQPMPTPKNDEEVVAIFPSPPDVREGVTYGPTGADFTGTLSAAPPPAPTEGKLARLRTEEIQGYIHQGKQAGVVEGQNSAADRMKAIVAACPGYPAMAIGAFLTSQTPEAVRLAYDAKVEAQTEADKRIAAMQEDHARQVALAAAGGYPGGVSMGLGTDNGDDTEDLDHDGAKVKAASEWDRNTGVRKGFSSKQNYVNFRASELMGQFRGVRQQVAKA